jgi:chorismate synthase
MIGCHIGRFFQITIAGGSYQEGLTAVVQGHPPGMLLTEQEIYGDLLLRKPGADELSSPRKEPDLPIIYSGLNAADTIEGAANRNHTNGTPLTILIPNYVKEVAGVRCPDITHDQAAKYTDNYKKMRRDLDPFYQQVYAGGRINPEMRFLEKIKILAEIENEIDAIRSKAPKMKAAAIQDKYGVHPVLNCPDINAAQKMVDACNRISKTGDSSGGVVQVVVTGAPIGLGEPVFHKLDAQLGRMLGIGAVKAVEVGAGFRARDMTGSQNNDQMRCKDGKVIFESNNAGGITGGLSTGQPIIVRLTVKPTPTIDKPQKTIDKYTLENKELAAITRRDPTIVARIWPVAENYTAMVILDNLIAHYGYQTLRAK